jgi:hypothetical protein
MPTEEAKLDQFLIARGGPFYTLQQHLGLLREDAVRAGLRAILFVGLSWGVPLILSLVAGTIQLPIKELLKAMKRLLIL